MAGRASLEVTLRELDEAIERQTEELLLVIELNGLDRSYPEVAQYATPLGRLLESRRRVRARAGRQGEVDYER